MAGVNNGLVILQSSKLFDDVIDGAALDSSFYAHDVHYKYEYYLVDIIYPK
ncbi:putative harbinger transposase-derived protein [Helianthus anomalus]